jgi:hypothetical protein
MTTPDYNTDFYTWTQAQAAALRAKDVAALDLAHLAEEIAGLGQSIEHAIESHLERLLLHLLKYQRKHPGLQHHPAHYLVEAYRHAREDGPDATGLPPATFPEACPWTVA